MYEPDLLVGWTHVHPPCASGGGGSSQPGPTPVQEAIMQHQATADGIYSTARPFAQSADSVRMTSDEASVVCKFDAAVLTPLNELAAALPLPGAQGAVWMEGAPLCRQVQEDLLATGTVGANSDTPLLQSSSGRVMCTRDVLDPSEMGHRRRPLTAHFALTWKAAPPLPVLNGNGPPTAGEQPGGVGASSGEQRPARRLRYICVGTAERVERLVDMQQEPLAPIELVAAWSDRGHVHHLQARAAIAQVFTHLQLARACYAFITCYTATWLAWCPPDGRRTLQVTSPFLPASRDETAGGGSVATVKGAMAWLQYEAIKNANVPVAPYPAGGLRAASSGAGNGGSNCGGGGSNNHDERKLPDAGGSASSDSSHRPPGATGHSASGARGEQQRQQPRGKELQAPSGPPPAPTLELHRRLCEGSAGLVVVGAVGGAPAVVKLLGPDDEGLDAYEAEVRAYAALQPLQGKVVPDLLAAGRAASGVHFLAVSRLPGQPLSDVARPLPLGVAQGAVAALQRLHGACPGFLHGDVRLQNIMLLPPGSAEEPARCMVIDFGRARLGGTGREQAREVRALERLLQ